MKPRPVIGYACHACLHIYEKWPGAKCVQCGQYKVQAGALLAGAMYACHACLHIYEKWPGAKCTQCGQYKVQAGALPAGAMDAPAHVLGTGKIEAQNRCSTGIEWLDYVLSGGAVEGHAVMLVGGPGAGKTTMCLHLLHNARKPLFLSAEQPESEVVNRATEMGVDVTRILFAEETELGAIERIAMKHRPTDLVLDSLSCVYDAASGRPPGSSWTLKESMRRLFTLSHSLKMTTWIICHINAKGKVSGPMAAVHWCDVLLSLTQEKDGSRLLGYPTPKKNRAGRTDLSVKLEMSAAGLDRAPPEPPPPEVRFAPAEPEHLPNLPAWALGQEGEIPR